MSIDTERNTDEEMEKVHQAMERRDHPNALTVEEQQKPWQCWNLACLDRNLQTDSLCWNCGNPRGYLDPEVEQLLKAHTESLLSAVETEVITQHEPNISGSPDYTLRKEWRNGLRSEQRSALNRLKERYLS
jgi:hypothetical protein